MKNKTLLIVIGLVLLCCCVLVIGGFVLAPIVQKYLNNASSGLQNFNPAATSSPDGGIATNPPTSANGPMNGGLADPKLKADVWNSLLNAESGKNCTNVTSTAIDVTQQPDSKGVWIENWTVNACGSTIVLKVTFTPDPNGGTNYDLTQQ